MDQQISLQTLSWILTQSFRDHFFGCPLAHGGEQPVLTLVPRGPEEPLALFAHSFQPLSQQP